MKLIVLLLIFGALGYVSADCYPGDAAYNKILQAIYKGVTTDKIVLTYIGTTPMSRQALCTILVNNHNYGRNPRQWLTNSNFLGQQVTQSACVNALTFTTGYSSLAGWQKWDGYHSGRWYSKTTSFSDAARWSSPYSKGQTYAVQPVRFDSQWRKENCKRRDITGATCRYGWNHSGKGVMCNTVTKLLQFIDLLHFIDTLCVGMGS